MYWNCYYNFSAYHLRIWLTLTWDVLKYIYYRSLSRKSLRLTLTWDVLKWMKCFTIQLIQIGLTLTWDVLKSDKTVCLAIGL